MIKEENEELEEPVDNFNFYNSYIPFIRDLFVNREDAYSKCILDKKTGKKFFRNP